ncbi:MAG: glycosyltransferase family 4 protein [Candidatus Thermoplasmatota archaeon]|nr:glycosyltransferase family 4 protein [Candidatus Thermoplasmatota archaeon]
MAKRLQQDNYDVTWVASKPRNLPRSEELDGFRIIRRGNLFTVFIFGFIYSIVTAREYDILIESISAIPFFAPRLGRKKMAMIHHIVDKSTLRERVRILSSMAYLIQNFLSPLVYRGVTILTNSKGTAEELRALGYNHASIVKTGVEIPPAEVKFESKADFIVSPGPLRPWKRIDHVIQAFSCSSERWRLKIFGDFLDEQYEKYIRHCVKNSGVQERIDILGHITDEEKVKLYVSSKICLIASRKEGWGLSAFEPQAYSCITVAYDVPGINESVINGVTGILVHDDDISELCRIVKQLTDDQNLIEQLSVHCYKRLMGYSWDECYLDFKKTIEE